MLIIQVCVSEHRCCENFRVHCILFTKSRMVSNKQASVSFGARGWKTIHLHGFLRVTSQKPSKSTKSTFFSFSVRNPPPICFGVPYLSKYASICLDFYNITWKEHIGGCVKLAVKLFHIIKKSFKMGCFNFNHMDEESKMAISRVLHELRQVQILRNQAELRMKKFDHLIL